MKKIKFMILALVAICGFTACEKDCDHDFIEVDYNKELVGTWTTHSAYYSEALVISADGSVVSTGIENGEYWEEVKGNINTVNNKMTMTFEDGDKYEGRFEIICGEAFSIIGKNGEHYTFRYCKEDLADEVVGMWVCNDSWTDDITVQTYSNDGKSTITTAVGLVTDNSLVNQESEYKVIGDLVFRKIPAEDNFRYIVARIVYTPDATEMGDVMTHMMYIPSENGVIENMGSWLRIKQYLELPGTKYDYMKTFVTNVKGEDKDIPFLNTSFNFAKMDGSIIDKFLKSILFTVEFPEANKIKYSYLLEGKNIVIDAPIEVDGNKMTIKMSANNPAYQDVDMYAFQDQDNTQMHWYMPTTSFEKFFGNTSVALMLGYGQLDKDDTEGIANVYKTIADAVESINLSLVMTKAK